MDAQGAALSRRPAHAVVRAAVRAALDDLAPGERVLVALSGGPDSLALLAATVRVAAESGLLLSCAVVDHGLQPDSAQVAGRAVEQARLLGCTDAQVVAVHVPRGPGTGGPEAAARAARYRALEALAAGQAGRPPAAAILLGHTRDDQAETVLLGLVRGSGLRSLAGMAPRSGVYRRPVLDLPRAVLRAAADELARRDPRLAPWVDPHNADERFARSRLRTAVLPQLESALGPGITSGLVRTAALARQDADALDGWADTVWARLSAEGAIRYTPYSAASCVLADLPGGLTGAPEIPDVPAAPGGPAAVALTDPAEPPPTAGAHVGDSAGSTAGGPGADPTSRELALDVSALAGRGPRSASGERCGHVGASPEDTQALPAAVRLRVVRRLLLAAGCPAGALGSEHVRAVADLLDGPDRNPARIALPAGRIARREGSWIRVRV